MDAFRHFGLRCSPFDDRPDPAFFYEAGGHDEALASVRYAVHAGKSCAAVIGESGFGKTLIARILAERVNRRTNVLWLNGVGQAKAQTELCVYDAGSLVGVGRFRGRPVEALLNAWARSTQAWANPTLLIVDSAESLRDSAWQDLLALMTREYEPGHRVTVALFGLPALRAQLGSARFERIRRRLFRLNELRAFTEAETAGYVTHRLRLAGREEPLFTDAALQAVFTATGGNPALINQLCDNALVDAFGEDRTMIDEPEVRSAVQAIAGVRISAPRAVQPARKRIPTAVKRVVSKAESTLAAIDQGALRPLIERVAATPPAATTELEQLAASLPPLSQLLGAAPPVGALAGIPGAEASPIPPAAQDATCPTLDDRPPACDRAVARPVVAAAATMPSAMAVAPETPAPIGPPIRDGLLDSRMQRVTSRITAALSRIRATQARRAVETAAAAAQG